MHVISALNYSVTYTSMGSISPKQEFMGFLWLQILLLILAKECDANDSSQLWVNITVLKYAAIREGAVCLDGSPPAYHLDPGSSQNWLIFLEGGGWCSTLESCAQRSQTHLGSSALMNRTSLFRGILSNSPDMNPDFYNWNRVHVRYCDGASFLSDAETINFTSPQLKAQVTFRGMKIWRAVIKDLLLKGMDEADLALLTGCSAGGLATILHCDDFKSLLPKRTKVKCVSDAGFFVDVKDVKGNFSFRSYYRNVVSLHNVSHHLPAACTSKFDAQCFFPQYILPYIQVPLLILNPAYDVWQIQNILVPSSADQHMEWQNCKMNPPNCSESQLETLQGFRLEFLDALSYAKTQDRMGLYINSCFTHCESESNEWNHVKAANKTVKQAIGEWYFERSPIEVVDSAYPSNPTCLPWLGWGH